MINIINERIKSSNNIELSLKCYNTIKSNERDLETIIFLNSSFFNQDQWKSQLFKIKSLISNVKQLRFITYDYTGVGESDYSSRSLTIKNFLDELESVIKWSGNKKVHIFGMSIGAWIGLNALYLFPHLIKSFTGYGNLAPYHEVYKQSISQFKEIENSFDLLESLKSEEINQNNWEKIFESFYLPFFFPEILEMKNSPTKYDNLKQLLSRLIFPFIKGNKVCLFHEYYKYLTDIIIKEGKTILKKINSSQIEIPILFMNGKNDVICNYLMAVDLNKRIPFSKLKLFENLGHGSIILGKGYNIILKNYVDFLNF